MLQPAVATASPSRHTGMTPAILVQRPLEGAVAVQTLRLVAAGKGLADQRAPAAFQSLWSGLSVRFWAL